MMRSSTKTKTAPVPESIKRVRYKQQSAAVASKNRRCHSSVTGGSGNASSLHRKKLSNSAPVSGSGNSQLAGSYLADREETLDLTPEDQEDESISLLADYSTINRRNKLGSTSSYLSLGGASNADADEMDGRGAERLQEQYDVGRQSDQQREQEAAKAEKLMLIKRLLANFNLEQTYDHYRNLYSRALVINPAAFSVDCAMPATRARERLQRMTGSDSVQLIDANYMTMLSKKYWEEYEDDLDKAEKQRMEAEKSRVRRLMVQGYITPEELRQVEQGSYKDEAAKRQAAKKKTKQPSHGTDQSADLRNSNSSPQKNTSKTVSMRLSEDEQASTSQSTHSQEADPEQQSQSELSHNGATSNGNGVDHDDQTPTENARHDSASPHPKSTTPTVKYTPKYTEPMLIKLYNQESVDSLYGLAEQLVPPRNKHKADSKTSSRRVVIQ